MDDPSPLLPRPLVAPAAPADALERNRARRSRGPGRTLAGVEPWRRPAALAVAAGGLLLAGWLFVHGLNDMFSCLFGCDEEDAARSESGQALMLLAGFTAIATTFTTHQVAKLGIVWHRMFGAWFALVAGCYAYSALLSQAQFARTATGLAYVAIAAFLAVILPLRDHRMTALCLLGGLVIATLLHPVSLVGGVVAGLAPFLVLEQTAARRMEA